MAAPLTYSPFRSLGRSILTLARESGPGSLFSATPGAGVGGQPHAAGMVTHVQAGGAQGGIPGQGELGWGGTAKADRPEGAKQTLLGKPAGPASVAVARKKSQGPLALAAAAPALALALPALPDHPRLTAGSRSLHVHAAGYATSAAAARAPEEDWGAAGGEFDLDPAAMVDALELDAEAGAAGWSRRPSLSPPPSSDESSRSTPDVLLSPSPSFPSFPSFSSLPNPAPFHPPPHRAFGHLDQHQTFGHLDQPRPACSAPCPDLPLLRRHLSFLPRDPSRLPPVLHLARRLLSHPTPPPFSAQDVSALIQAVSRGPQTEQAMADLRRLVEVSRGLGHRVQRRDLVAAVGCWARFGWTVAVEREWEHAVAAGDVDIWLANARLDSLARARHVHLPSAHAHLALLPTLGLKPNLATYNLLARAHAACADVAGARSWADRIRSDLGARPNAVTRMCVMDAMARAGDARGAEREAMEVVRDRAAGMDVRQQALRYAVQAQVKAGDLPASLRLFRLSASLPCPPDLALWSIAVAACAELSGSAEQAEHLLAEWPRTDEKGELRRLEAAATAYGALGDIPGAWRAFLRAAELRGGAGRARAGGDAQAVPDSTWRTLVRAHLTPAARRGVVGPVPADTGADADMQEQERPSLAVSRLPDHLAAAGVPPALRRAAYAELASRLARSGRPNLAEEVLRVAAERDGVPAPVHAVNDAAEGWCAVADGAGEERAARALAGMADGARLFAESGLSEFFPDALRHPTAHYPCASNAYTRNLALRLLARRSHAACARYLAHLRAGGHAAGAYAWDCAAEAAGRWLEGGEREQEEERIRRECARAGVRPNWGRDGWLAGVFEGGRRG